MDFEAVIKTLNKHLTEERPQKFNSSWVRRTAPRIYRFIQNTIRTETGGIDWDLITRALNPEFLKQWTASYRKRAKPYRNKSEVGTNALTIPGPPPAEPQVPGHRSEQGPGVPDCRSGDGEEKAIQIKSQWYASNYCSGEVEVLHARHRLYTGSSVVDKNCPTVFLCYKV